MAADDDDLFDLQAQRVVRREKTGRKPITLRLNGNTHELPPELPLDVFAPLEALDVDVALLLRLAMERDEGRDVSGDATNVVIDMLISNPALPKEVLAAIRAMSVALMGQPAYDDLIASRPTAEDLAALGRYLFGKYRVSLPEASGSSELSPTGGPISNPTSSASTESTPGVSGADPVTTVSSGSAA